MFLRLPRRRLVILGDWAAGKTHAVRMIAEALLDRPGPETPLPVFIPVESWTPAVFDLAAWISQEARRGPDAVDVGELTRLIAAGRIVAVIDGLDRVPEKLLPRVLETINATAPLPLPVLITCRRAEYERLLAAGHEVRDATEIELLPAEGADVLEYLPGLDVPTVSAGPASILRQPLMAALARDRFGPAGGAAELLDRRRFPDRAAIAGHLLPTLVPRIGDRRWLTTLAEHLAAAGREDLAWWELHRTAPQRRIGFAAAMLAGCVFAGLAALIAWIALGLAAGGRFPLPVLTVQLLGFGFHGVGIGLMAGVATVLACWYTPKPVRLGRRPSRPFVPADTSTVLSGRALLSQARAVAITQTIGAGAGLAAGLCALLAIGTDARTYVEYRLPVAIETALMVAIIVLLSGCWGRYCCARAWLAVRRRLPWRPMAFLDRMVDTGVLHRTGVRYRFADPLVQNWVTPDRVDRTAPPREVFPADLPLTETVLRALNAASAAHLPQRRLDTRTLLIHLIDADATADWDRILLHCGGLDALRRSTLRDPLVQSRDGWSGTPLTGTCAQAMHTAARIARRYRLLPVPAGALAIGLVADPDSAATRALSDGSAIGHPVLLDLIARTLLGNELANLHSVVRDRG